MNLYFHQSALSGYNRVMENTFYGEVFEYFINIFLSSTFGTKLRLNLCQNFYDKDTKNTICSVSVMKQGTTYCIFMLYHVIDYSFRISSKSTTFGL